MTSLDIPTYEELLPYLTQTDIHNLASTCWTIKYKITRVMRKCKWCLEEYIPCYRSLCYKCGGSICINTHMIVRTRVGDINNPKYKKCCMDCAKCISCNLTLDNNVNDCDQCGKILCLRCCADNRGKCQNCRISLFSLIL